MSRRVDQQYLLDRQYHDASNLKARKNLYSRFKTNPYDWFVFVFDHFVLPQNAVILELGCGPGNLWVNNLERIPCYWDVTLSDLSPGMLEETQRNLSTSKRTFQFKVVDAQQLPMPDEHFVAFIANHMLYHVPNRPKAFAEIYRVLKPDGILFAATNGEKHLAELDEFYEQLVTDLSRRIMRAFSTGTFTLENGNEQLAPWFRTDIRHYENSLIVTEAEPLTAYLLSMLPFDTFQSGEIHADTVYELIQNRISIKGHIHIKISTGIFIAKKNIH